jgi:hypothetical protein
MTFQYQAVNPYHLMLRLLSLDADDAPFAMTLAPIGKAIRGSINRIENEANAVAEDAAVITDDEVELIENLLGTAFVVCQTEITAVVSRAKRLHAFFQAREGRPLGLNDSKTSILSLGAGTIAGSSCSDVEVIDAFSNYFKHRDEWPTDWAELGGRRAATVAVITAAGAKQGSTGNLRAGARALGNPQFHTVSIFGEAVGVWATTVKEAYRVALESEGVMG